MLLHPNRTFTTVIQGAVFGTELTKNYDCTLSLLPARATDSTDFTASNIAATQSGENTFELTFTGKDDSGEEEVRAKATINVSGDTATATVVSIDEDDNTTQLAMSGSVEKSGNSIETFDLTTTDEAQSLNCSVTQ